VGDDLRRPSSRRRTRHGLVGGDASEVVVSRTEGALRLVDDAAEVIGRLGPWTALLWITALPSRFLFAFLASELMILGSTATAHGDWLRRLAYATLLAWLISLYGRYVFVRACRHALQSGRPPPRAILRPVAAEIAGYLGAALVIEAAFWLLFLTAVIPIALLVGAGLAAAASTQGGPGMVEPLRELGRSISPSWRLIRLLLIFAFAAVFVAVNVHLLVQAGTWLASGVAGLDTAGWDTVLAPRNPLYDLLVLCAVGMLLEPFWLAALTDHVELVRSRSSGDDLRRWFAELRARA
jgi:hypothetical protein